MKSQQKRSIKKSSSPIKARKELDKSEKRARKEREKSAKSLFIDLP